MYESFFIEPPKGQEAIKSVLIVIGDLLSDLTSSFSIYTTAEDD